MAKHTRRRVTLRLDSAIQTERQILERLDALPGRSGTDWLRALLTQGLLAEQKGQFVGLPPDTPPPPSAAAKTPDRAENTQSAASQTDTPRESPTESTAGKPFARLREIVG